MVNKKQLAVGSALAAAAAAGYYYFYASKDATNNRKRAARWASDMKSQVLLEARRVQNLDRKELLKIVDKVAEAYKSARDIDPKELTRAVRELKSNWQSVAGEAAKKPRAKKRVVKKQAKRSS
jgi:hypothetical protein